MTSTIRVLRALLALGAVGCSGAQAQPAPSTTVVVVSPGAAGGPEAQGSRGPNTVCNVEAGPLWNNDHGQRACPGVCSAVGGRFDGRWWTTVPGAMSVCQCAVPAQTRCPAVDLHGTEPRGEGTCAQQSYRGHSYWFCDGARGWAAARAACGQLQADLVAIEDADEEAFVERAGRVHFPDNAGGVFAGASDTGHEGLWVWSTGQHVGFAAWREHEPNNVGDGGEGCLEFFPVGGGGWNDVPCELPRPFVCEAGP